MIAAADVLHLTGITPALGPGAAGGGRAGHRHRRGRQGLSCPSMSTTAPPCGRTTRPAPVLARLAAAADLVFAGPEEAALMLGWDRLTGAADVRRRRASRPRAGQTRARHGRGQTRCARGAGAVRRRGAPVARPAITVVDAVGAGDAFVAGYLSELVAGGPVPDCLRTGNALGAAVCQRPRRLGGPAHPRRTGRPGRRPGDRAMTTNTRIETTVNDRTLTAHAVASPIPADPLPRRPGRRAPRRGPGAAARRGPARRRHQHRRDHPADRRRPRGDRTAGRAARPARRRRLGPRRPTRSTRSSTPAPSSSSARACRSMSWPAAGRSTYPPCPAWPPPANS